MDIHLPLLSRFLNLLGTIGEYALYTLCVAGKFSIFLFNSLRALFCRPFYLKKYLQYAVEMLFGSIHIVFLTGLFAGAVVALQSYNGFTRFNAEGSIPVVATLSIVRELGPVLVGLISAGRISSSIAAEIGSMVATNQISAMTVLSVSPFKFLITPRIIVGIIMLPILTFIADIIGVLGAYMVCTLVLDFSGTNFITNSMDFLSISDVTSGLIKACVFGGIVTIVGAYNGYKSAHSAQGVGLSTTNAVVCASMAILAFNYFLTALLF